MTPLVLQILFQKTLNDTKINSASYIKDMTLNTKHKQFWGEFRKNQHGRNSDAEHGPVRRTGVT